MKLQLKTASSTRMRIRARVEMLSKTRGVVRLFWACDQHRLGAPYSRFTSAPICGECAKETEA